MGEGRREGRKEEGGEEEGKVALSQPPSLPGCEPKGAPGRRKGLVGGAGAGSRRGKLWTSRGNSRWERGVDGLHRS